MPIYIVYKTLLMKLILFLIAHSKPFLLYNLLLFLLHITVIILHLLNFVHNPLSLLYLENIFTDNLIEDIK
jgi:hypothetical protein